MNSEREGGREGGREGERERERDKRGERERRERRASRQVPVCSQSMRMPSAEPAEARVNKNGCTTNTESYLGDGTRKGRPDLTNLKASCCTSPVSSFISRTAH